MNLLFPLVLALSLGAPSGTSDKTSGPREKRRVTKASVYLVKAPSFLAPRVSSPIVRGESIDVTVPASAGWYAAQYKEKKGYLHQSYVADRAIAFQISDADVKDQSSISGNYNLAVGGFSEGAEGHLRKKNADDGALEQGYRWMDEFLPVDYSTRSAMPADPEGLRAFIEKGRLLEPTSRTELAAQTPAPEQPESAPAPATGGAR